ncbi:MAG: arginine deiminase family protein [Thermoanaerobaculia bacterium]|nr:arginine deiminase family protein [Thermoanaerobaculia bacterium]
MTIEVRSEIGRLRRVLVHRPGREIDWMVPALMDRLLFDDILYGEDARWEHEIFCGVLSAAGVEVLDPEDLLKKVLDDAAVRESVVRHIGSVEPEADLVDELEALDAAQLATALVAGLPADDVGPGERIRHFYRLAPVPNYFFQRDPQVVLGDRVLVSSMATDARAREPYLSSLAFEHHGALSGWSEMIRLGEQGAGEFVRRPWVEGGDVLVPAADVLMVGVSERTNRYGVDSLAKHLQRSDSGFRHLVVVEIPSRRSYMHLDTVFTFIDHGLCLGFVPVVDPDGFEASDVYRVDLGAREISYTVCDGLPGALRGVGIDCELVPCGGPESLIDQQREQWTDGANAFAVAPGVILLYRRNRRTCDELDRRGFRVIDGEDVVDGQVPLLGEGPTAVVLPDNELSRARGGPRCMTMPLLRDALK